MGLRFVPAVIQRFTSLGTPVSYLALVLLAAAQSLGWAIGAGAASFLRRHARWPFEAAFGGGVLIAASIPTIFTWTPAGLITPWPAFVQLGDVIGERGLSALFGVVSALVATAVSAAVTEGQRRAALRSALGAVLLIAALPTYGALRMAAISRAVDGSQVPLRVGLVDHAVHPRDRWDPKNHPAILRTLRELTRDLEAQGVELTVWPEGAYPYDVAHNEHAAPGGRKRILGDGVRGPLLIGLITRQSPSDLQGSALDAFNSAVIVTPDGTLSEPYDKIELLWFGEMVPGGAQFPWLRRTFQRSGGLLPGAGPKALDIPSPHANGLSPHMAVLNCYEDTLPAAGRHLATTLKPNLLVNITNDAWFEGTAEPELHARLAAMRAIELRLDLVRAVNLGVTSWVDASGTVRARYADPTPGTLIVTPTLREHPLTFYARFGDRPLFALLVTAALLGGCRRRCRTEKLSSQ